jgi:enolase-phosphatase E1
MSELFLFDIEGTTTDINFVHKVLFPYSQQRLPSFVNENKDRPEVAKALQEVAETVKTEDGRSLDLQGIIATLDSWVKNDRKHGALKELQGFIWEEGYNQGTYQGHVYSDVKPFFQAITGNNKKVGIYSSGSVHAQKLIFGHSAAGDLTNKISYYFDTKVGAKREPESYKNIAHQVGLSPSDIHFFSDIPQELVAAQAAGFLVTHVVREGTALSEFPMIKDFSEANLK